MAFILLNLLVQPPLLIAGDELIYLQMKGSILEIISIKGAVNFSLLHYIQGKRKIFRRQAKKL